jgi:hypothetical protein
MKIEKGGKVVRKHSKKVNSQLNIYRNKSRPERMNNATRTTSSRRHAKKFVWGAQISRCKIHQKGCCTLQINTEPAQQQAPPIPCSTSRLQFPAQIIAVSQWQSTGTFYSKDLRYIATLEHSSSDGCKDSTMGVRARSVGNRVETSMPS